MKPSLRIEYALSDYFRAKQFAMGQRFNRERVVSALAQRGLPSDEVEATVEAWQAEGLLRLHGSDTISLTPAAYPKVMP